MGVNKISTSRRPLSLVIRDQFSSQTLVESLLIQTFSSFEKKNSKNSHFGKEKEKIIFFASEGKPCGNASLSTEREIFDHEQQKGR